MRRIQLSDAAFLYAERRETPMHVGGLSLYTLPKGVSEQEFADQLRPGKLKAQDFRPPFGEFVATGRAGPLGPLYWDEDEHLEDPALEAEKLGVFLDRGP